MKKAISYSLRNCTTIVPVSSELIEYDYSYFDAKVKKQGYRHFIPELNTPAKVIYNGYEMPADQSVDRRMNSFITVARITNSVQYELKGIDLLRKLAVARPECSFTIVGISENVSLQFKLTELRNVNCIAFTAPEKLHSLFAEHQFYLCLSLSEGFPNAPCEGMSHGCIPIGSHVSSIPFIVGNTGRVLKHRNVEELCRLIDGLTAMSENELQNLSTAARNRIETEFSIQKRKEAFYQLIETSG